MGIVRAAIVLGGNCPRVNCPMWQLSGGNCPEGNCRVGNCPVPILGKCKTEKVYR